MTRRYNHCSFYCDRSEDTCLRIRLVDGKARLVILVILLLSFNTVSVKIRTESKYWRNSQYIRRYININNSWCSWFSVTLERPATVNQIDELFAPAVRRQCVKSSADRVAAGRGIRELLSVINVRRDTTPLPYPILGSAFSVSRRTGYRRRTSPAPRRPTGGWSPARVRPRATRSAPSRVRS